MKSSYIHDGTAWKRVLAPFVHDGSSYRQPNKIYTHDGTAWKLTYDTGYRKILASGTIPEPNGAVVWSSGLAFVNYYGSGTTNVYHFDGTNTTRLGASGDYFLTPGLVVRPGDEAIFTVGSVLLAYKTSASGTICKWTGSAWQTLPTVSVNGTTYYPDNTPHLMPIAARNRVTQETILFFSVTYYDYGASQYKIAICIYNDSTNAWDVSYHTGESGDIGWIHRFGGTLYAISGSSLFSLSGSTWSKVCSLPATITPTYYHLTDDGTTLFLSGSISAESKIYKLSGGSFTSISTTRFGAVGFGGKLWVYDSYYSGSTWTGITLAGYGPSGNYNPFMHFFFIENAGTYYVMHRGEPYSTSYALRDITDGSNYKSSGGDIWRFYTYRIAQGASKIYSLQFGGTYANSYVYEYDLAGQQSTW